MNSAHAVTARPGRPRLVPRSATAVEPREEILHAAAELFVTHGFAATSTRDIAEKVGVRQSSLYHYFTGKPDILAELLRLSVRPSLDKVEEVEMRCPAEIPEAALYLLALIDIDTLAEVPHNIGKLYLMPDVRKSEVFAEFQPARRKLQAAYGRLGAEIASEPVVDTVSVNQLSQILIEEVEVAIRTRADGDEITPAFAQAIATSCLRVCGTPASRIKCAATTANDLARSFIKTTSK